ncbi:hypothetical protein HK102_004099, partial [Quaeritorhiza haematococci]
GNGDDDDEDDEDDEVECFGGVVAKVGAKEGDSRVASGNGSTAAEAGGLDMDLAVDVGVDSGAAAGAGAGAGASGAAVMGTGVDEEDGMDLNTGAGSPQRGRVLASQGSQNFNPSARSIPSTSVHWIGA